MFFPTDVWIEIKKYLFKTHEMKEYDKFVIYFNKWSKFINNLKFKYEPYEQMLYDNWSFSKKILFVKQLSPYGL